jgi:hypothetical protein
LELPSREYTLESFRSMLVKSPDAFPNLKEILFLTTFKTWGQGEPYTLQGMLHHHDFQVRRLGELKELVATYLEPETGRETKVKYIAHLDADRQILTCFTQATREQIRVTIEPLSGEIGIYHLWISPLALEQIKNTILSEHPYTKIRSFSADRHPSVGVTAKLRPEFRRGLIYRGDDGRETLEELRYYYGVLPSSIEFSIPGLVDFRLNNRGMFFHVGGSLEYMFDYADRATELVLQVRRILEQSKLQIVDIATERKHLKIPHLVPWAIDFKRTLDLANAELLVDELEQNKFAIYNSVMTQGSVRFDGSVFDEIKKSVFAISSDEHRMVVSPRYQTSFDSFLRFYEIIAENFDPEAKCTAPL